MAYPATLTDLQNMVLNLLDEASNSTIGDLRSGTGAASTLTTTQTITEFINEAASDFARWCYPLRDVATYSNFPTSTIFVDFTSALLVPATYYKMWAARTVSYNGVLLSHCAQSYIETAGLNFTANYPNDTAATPLFWFENGMAGIGVYPPTSASTHSLVVTGLAQPVQLSAGSDVTPFQADQNKVLAYQAAKRIAQKAISDPSIAERIAMWDAEFSMYKEANIQHMWAVDPPFAAIHYPRPTLLSAPAGSAFLPSTDLM